MLLIKNCTAIKFLFLLSLCLSCAFSFAAQVAGAVTHLSGPLLVKKADGTVKVLTQKSTVEQGDVLIAEKDTYARIKFADNSEVTLRPNTQLRIDQFSFEEDKPNNDGFAMTLIKGGMRAVTGILGKRNKERFGLNTPTASIGIRGTIFIAEYVPPELSGVNDPQGAGRPPGLYIQVLDGTIFLKNDAGLLEVSAGQFAYAISFSKPPVLLPNNPGMQFSPPVSFPAGNSQENASNEKKSGSLICEVR
ncbi:FecR family protein [Undibacterium sp. Di26W]|uniref:FecR family protein n=1 Tax=Undibacterium sp. Di26W TaxID=3413035 RepID=UPI003BF3F1AB